MSKRNIFIVILILFVILLLYLATQISFTKKTTADNITAEDVTRTDTANHKIVVDEKQLAVEEYQRNVGKSGLSNLYIVKCSACHGRDGMGPIGSPIAGKSYEYNFNKLMEYKENKVKNTMMKGILDSTSIQELQMLATEVSTFK